MNPLPNRPLLSNPSLPLTLPNVPSLDQMAYNGRPRKIVPEVGKDFPVLNGMSLMGGPMTAPAGSGPQGPLLDNGRMSAASTIALHPPHSQQQQQGPLQTSNIQSQQPQTQVQTLQLQTQQLNKDGQDKTDASEPQLQTAIFRPDNEGEWRERLRQVGVYRPDNDGEWKERQRARSEKLGQQGPMGLASWDTGVKDDDDEVKDDESELDDDEACSTSEDDGKLWRPRRTLRKLVSPPRTKAKTHFIYLHHCSHLDAVRALAFHPTEMCLATGGDDCTVKIWRMEMAGLATPAYVFACPSNKKPDPFNSARVTTEVKPQLTLRGHSAPITTLVHSPAKRLLYSASLDSSIRIWALPPPSHTTYAPYDSSRIRGELIGHTDAVWGLALIRDETLLISCGAEGAVKVWDVNTPSGVGSLKLSWGYNGLDSDEDDAEMSSETPGATALEAIKSDIKKVAVGYQNAVVSIFHVDTGKRLLRLHSEVNTGV